MKKMPGLLLKVAPLGQMQSNKKPGKTRLEMYKTRLGVYRVRLGSYRVRLEAYKGEQYWCTP